MKKLIFAVENLDCANCASKIEQKIRQHPMVEEASLSFMTKQLSVTAADPAALLPEFQQIAASIEPDARITLPEKAEKKPLSSDLIAICTGTALFLLGILGEKLFLPFPWPLVLYAAAYLILGGEVLLTAFRNILHGQIFDENFLMSLATLGAFAIRKWPEAVGVMLFYRVGEYFEERAVEKSRSQIMDAVDLRPETVQLITDDETQVINAGEAAVGDILLVRPGDRIPLDGVILEGDSQIDTSPVTGEPVPVTAGPGAPVISGCVNMSGLLKIRVEKVLAESMVTRILNSVENAAANKPRIDRFITRFARIYTPFVVLAALFTALALPFLLPDWHFFVDGAYTGPATAVYGSSGTASIFTALTFLVISCPCALVLSVPLAFFSGIGAGSKKGILFKGGIVMESLKNIKAVVMDKTGTITRGNFVLQKIICADPSFSEDELLSLCASCELSSTHPIGHSIRAAAAKRDLLPEQPTEVTEAAGQGIRAVTSAGVILCGNRKLMEENGIPLDSYGPQGFGTEVLAALNGRFLGYLLISDTLKADAQDAIRRTKKMGIVTAMLTGDAAESAKAVAGETGIDEVHARLLPQDKYEKLQNIRFRHGSVMFVGDGINDAPVLAGADVGAAMGSGADAAIEAADVVFLTSEMSAIPLSIEIARTTGRIAVENVYFALAVKAAVMVLGLMGFANMWFAVFADTGVAVLCLLNSIRILYRK